MRIILKRSGRRGTLSRIYIIMDIGYLCEMVPAEGKKEEEVMWSFNRDQRIRDLQERFCIRPSDTKEISSALMTLIY